MVGLKIAFNTDYDLKFLFQYRLYCSRSIPCVLAIEIVKRELFGGAGFWYVMSSSGNNRGSRGPGESEVEEI